MCSGDVFIFSLRNLVVVEKILGMMNDIVVFFGYAALK